VVAFALSGPARLVLTPCSPRPNSSRIVPVTARVSSRKKSAVDGPLPTFTFLLGLHPDSPVTQKPLAETV
jgi:hypothetical protein